MIARLTISAALLFALVPFSRAEEIVRAAHPVTRQVTGDLTLEQAVKLALQQNPDILKQLQEIERTRGLIIEARAEALPHLAVVSNYDQQAKPLVENIERPKTSGTEITTLPVLAPGGQVIDLAPLLSAQSGAQSQLFRKSPDKTWQVSFEVRQVLYAGGQVRAGIAIAKFTEDSAYWQLRDTIDRIIAGTRTQFYTVLTNRSLITVAEETVKLQEDLLKDQKNRFEAGTVPRFNVLRAEVELANVIPTLIRAKNDYLISEINLARTLGLDPGPGGQPSFRAVGELGLSTRPFDIIQALELGKARRPFLKVQRQQIKIQVENIKVALAGYQPRIEANGGYLFRNSRLTDDIESQVDGWFFGVTGTWNIFDGLATYGQVKQARAQLESAHINYRDSVLQVELEVQQAYANLIAQRETIKSQQKNVEQAVEALRLANERLSAGAGTQLEVLDARVALTRARTTELVARGDYNKALAEFDRATAIDTAYLESFRDPLKKLETKILGAKPEPTPKTKKPAPATPQPAKKKSR
jgi:outer membrane protein TolC